MASALCTIANLTARADEVEIIDLAADENNDTRLLSDSDVQARLAEYIAEGSSKIRTRLLKRIPDINALVASDSELARQLSGYCVTYVLLQLYIRARRFTESSNPWLRAWKEAKEEMDEIRVGTTAVGTEPIPVQRGSSNTLNSSPAFGKAASGSSGSDATDIDRFAG